MSTTGPVKERTPYLAKRHFDLFIHDKLYWVERPFKQATGNETRPLKEPQGKSSNQRLRARGLFGARNEQDESANFVLNTSEDPRAR